MTQSMLGRALAERQQFAEAEPLLLAGSQFLHDSTATNPAWGSDFLPATLGWLVELCADWSRPAEAAGWRAALAAEAAVKSAARR